MQIAERVITEFLESVGITINGPNPWDMTVRNREVFWRVLSQGGLGLGKSYTAGWWDCPHLDQFFERVLKNGLPWGERLTPPSMLISLKSKLINFGVPRRAFEIGKTHYDIGNSLYKVMLDPETMSYSCAYGDELETGEIAKCDLVCEKIGLKAGQTMLDVGCGFGGLAVTVTFMVVFNRFFSENFRKYLPC